MKCSVRWMMLFSLPRNYARPVVCRSPSSKSPDEKHETKWEDAGKGKSMHASTLDQTLTPRRYLRSWLRIETSSLPSPPLPSPCHLCHLRRQCRPPPLNPVQFVEECRVRQAPAGDRDRARSRGVIPIAFRVAVTDVAKDSNPACRTLNSEGTLSHSSSPTFIIYLML